MIDAVKGSEAREFVEEEELAGIEGCQYIGNLSLLV